MGAHSSDLHTDATDSDSDSSDDDQSSADDGAATVVNTTAANASASSNATDDCEVCLVAQREPRLALVPCGHQHGVTSVLTLVL